MSVRAHGRTHLVRDLPDGALTRDQVLARWPVLRQSDLSRFDDCELSAWFNMKFASGLTTHPMARGIIEHRVYAECLREMQRQQMDSIPVASAWAILEETLRQRNVAPQDRVRVPLREMPEIWSAVSKWAKETFSVEKILDIERRLTASVSYRVPDTGELIERQVTGQLDLMVMRGRDELIVVDYKGSWGIPPKRDEDAQEPGLSYHGYFQQRFYALLAFLSFPSVNAVVLREFYQRRKEARPARVVRSELPRIQEEMSILVEAFDEAMMAGPPPKLTVEALEEHGHWKPQPGKHCFFCPQAARCPLDDTYTDGGVRSSKDAERAAAVYQVASAVRKRMKELCEGWVDLHGPIPVKYAKGRLVLGHRKVKNGTRFECFVPKDSDRPSTEEAFNPNVLEDAMRASVDELRKIKEMA